MADDLVGIDAGGVHREVGLAVVGLARAVERLDLVAPAPGQHRPRARALRALVHRVELAAEPHHGAHGPQRLGAPVAAGQAPAGGDHVARLEREQPHRLLLQRAEVGLAPLGEDVRDRAALLRGDHVVGLHEAAAEPAGEEPPHRRLARPHEARPGSRCRPCVHPAYHHTPSPGCRTVRGGGRPAIGAVAHPAAAALGEVVVHPRLGADAHQPADALARRHEARLVQAHADGLARAQAEERRLLRGVPSRVARD